VHLLDIQRAEKLRRSHKFNENWNKVMNAPVNSKRKMDDLQITRGL